MLRPATLAIVLAAPALALLTLAVVTGPLAIDAADESRAAVRQAGVLAAPLDLADAVGSLPIWIGLIAVCAVLVGLESWLRAAQLVLVAVTAEVVTNAMKVLVGRPRPVVGSEAEFFVGAAFPSGHVVRTAVLFGVALVLVPWCARHARLTIGVAVVAVMVMGLARVSAGAHHTSDVLAACLLAAVLLGGWSLFRSRPREVLGSMLAVTLALALVSAPTMAASPSPATGGDPRSSGQGPGFMGDPGSASLVVVGIGLASALLTYLYVKATPRPQPGDKPLDTGDT